MLIIIYIYNSIYNSVVSGCVVDRFYWNN